MANKINKLIALAKDQAATIGEIYNAMELACKMSNGRIVKMQNEWGIAYYWDNISKENYIFHRKATEEEINDYIQDIIITYKLA